MKRLRRSIPQVLEKSMRQFVCIALTILLCGPTASRAHETDQYTLPGGREFADVGDALTARFYRVIAEGVEKANATIRKNGGNAPSVQSSEGIASVVNK